MNQAALLLGSNLGDRMTTLDKAAKRISEGAGSIIKASPVYETAPWGNTDQDNFLNKALLIETHLSPQDLLMQLLNIEKELGRVRIEKWGPRIIDIDILYYDEDIIYSHDLKIPHPFMQDRRFTLIALNEISPDWFHPLLRRTVGQMLEECKDTGIVNLYQGVKDAI